MFVVPEQTGDVGTVGHPAVGAITLCTVELLKQPVTLSVAVTVQSYVPAIVAVKVGLAIAGSLNAPPAGGSCTHE